MPRDFARVNSKLGAGMSAAVFGATLSVPGAAEANLAVKVFAPYKFDDSVPYGAEEDLPQMLEHLPQMLAEFAVARLADDLGVGPRVAGTRVVHDSHLSVVMGGLTMAATGKDFKTALPELMRDPESEERVRLGVDGAFAALKALHAVGMFHGDVNLGNVAFAVDGKRVLLIDFGYGGAVPAGARDLSGLAVSDIAGLTGKQSHAFATIAKEARVEVTPPISVDDWTKSARDWLREYFRIREEVSRGKEFENVLTRGDAVASRVMAWAAVDNLETRLDYAQSGAIVAHYAPLDRMARYADAGYGGYTSAMRAFVAALVAQIEAGRETKDKGSSDDEEGGSSDLVAKSVPASTSSDDDTPGALLRALSELGDGAYPGAGSLPWHVVVDVVPLWTNLVTATRLGGGVRIWGALIRELASANARAALVASFPGATKWPGFAAP
jgi:hypothetical protein